MSDRESATAFTEGQGFESQKSDSPIQYFSSAHWKRTYQRAHAIVQNPADAEDIAQETYVRLFQTFLAGHEIESCMAWMKGVIRRVIVDQFRKTRPDLHVPSGDGTEEADAGERRRGCANLADPSISVEERLAQESLVVESLRVLAGLPEWDRECVLMYARGYKFAQIARALEMPYEAAIETTRKALAKTRRRIERAGSWKPVAEWQRDCSTIRDRRSIRVTSHETSTPAEEMEGVSEPPRAGLTKPDRYSFGDVVFEVCTNKVLRGGKILEFSSKEFELLQYFLGHQDETLTRGRLQQEVWGYGNPRETRTLDTHISRVRQKVEPDPKKPRFVVTVRNIGYKFIS
jgi:RNA polymerase sigma factor (sigma-70 family)